MVQTINAIDNFGQVPYRRDFTYIFTDYILSALDENAGLSSRLTVAIAATNMALRLQMHVLRVQGLIPKLLTRFYGNTDLFGASSELRTSLIQIVTFICQERYTRYYIFHDEWANILVLALQYPDQTSSASNCIKTIITFHPPTYYLIFIDLLLHKYKKAD